MYSVYVLRSLKDGRRYIGQTEDLQQRLRDHSAGRVTSTRNRRPFVLIYFESMMLREDALKREKYFKSAAGRNYLKGKGA